ncbi:DUF397 domain-containing protein [Thermomonospora sp. CIF 1]|uniref:DUF397 domain-containing protein n=1 Tax=Thermomonospora sp. CIF 1 TaxID=1916083 RepID=UPI000CB2DB19|nr:DUF397 domain-containing protein [Thermomonospora sp. CIF 1]PKK12365.1 MAG: DUF397 domain-containing protein [Thermomonospora sp. CIF 1]
MNVFSSAAWRKSSHSYGGSGDCVELTTFQGMIGARDSKNPAAGYLQIGKQDFAALLREIKAGHYDL